jgi:lipid-binding SYLF domain-containing protein
MRKVFSLIGAALILCAAVAPSAFADTKTDERLVDARQVFETFIDIKEQAIPTWLLQRAYGIVVVPRVIKGALIIGGRGGKGVFAVRNPDATWTNPVFITLAGSNIGF